MDRGHEAFAGGIAQIGAFTAHCFRDEKGDLARERKHGRVKLDKLRIGDGCRGPQRHGQAIGGGALGVRGRRPEMTGAAGGEHGHGSIDQR
jgi:hypothetical protein